MSRPTPTHPPDLAPIAAEDGPRHPRLLGLALAAITVAIVVALATSEVSGTGAVDVGDAGAPLGQPAPPEAPAPAPTPSAERDLPPQPTAPEPPPPRNCDPTESNPGGDNNYIPDAPALDTLGEGFEITGVIRSASGCRPLAGVPVQVWLATETGDETQNRATVLTDREGRYRIETAPTIPQFGEPNIHVAYDGPRYGTVFIRRVVDLDDARALVDLTLAR